MELVGALNRELVNASAALMEASRTLEVISSRNFSSEMANLEQYESIVTSALSLARTLWEVATSIDEEVSRFKQGFDMKSLLQHIKKGRGGEEEGAHHFFFLELQVSRINVTLRDFASLLQNTLNISVALSCQSNEAQRNAAEVDRTIREIQVGLYSLQRLHHLYKTSFTRTYLLWRRLSTTCWPMLFWMLHGF